jgi:hypothetical protein
VEVRVLGSSLHTLLREQVPLRTTTTGRSSFLFHAHAAKGDPSLENRITVQTILLLWLPLTTLPRLLGVARLLCVSLGLASTPNVMVGGSPHYFNIIPSPGCDNKRASGRPCLINTSDIDYQRDGIK